MQIFNVINLNNVRGDVFGGVTAAVIALPMALAFGVASGAGAEAGLYGAILVGLFAALFGGTPTLMSEPTGPMTVIFTAVIVKLMADNPDNGMAMAFTVVMMAGLFQIIFGTLRLGKYVTLMPYPVVSGFMSGIGIILIILQLAPLVGHPTPGGDMLDKLQSLPSVFDEIHQSELILGLITLAILFFMPGKLKKLVPPQLIALVIGVLVSILVLSDPGIRRIGEIPTGLPELQMPSFSRSELMIMTIDALVLGMLGCIDALLTSVIADSLTRTQHRSNKELIGQGLGNMASGLFGGLPGAGATMGTVVGIQAGSKTALAGLVRVGVLIIVVFWAGGLTAYIPLAVLAGIAFKVGVDIIDWSFLRRVHLISRKGALITYGVISLTVFVDLIVAVGLGLFVANIITITRLSELHAEDVTVVTDPDKTNLKMSQHEKDLFEIAGGRVTLLHLRGTLIFGVSRVISQQHNAIDKAYVLIIDLSEVNHIGVSAALALEEAVLEMIRADHEVYVAGAKDQPLERLTDLGIQELLPEERFVADREVALRQASKILSSKDRDVGPRPEEEA
jgi:SulP family sulfate permease